MKRKTLITGTLLSFLGGVFFFDLFRNEFIFAFVPFFPILCVLPRILPKVFLLWGTFFFLGCLRAFLGIHHPQEGEIAYFASAEEDSQKVRIIGTILNFPDIRSGKTRVHLQVKSLQMENKPKQDVAGKILVNLPTYPTVSYGDKLEVAGTLEIPPEWEDFSYRRFLEKKGIYAYMPRTYFRMLEHNQGTYLFSFLFSLRAWIENTIRSRIPEPEASFGVGILLGGERGFPEEIIEEFRITGLSHLLALSGSNITILILFVFWLCKLLPKYISLILTGLFVTAFVLLTGAEASVVRAGVMGMLALFVLHFGHEGNPISTLLWSAFLIILWNPFLLLSDVSFQLSVAGVLGLILFTPLWGKFFEQIPEFCGFKDALQTTLAAQVTAVPLVAFYFKRLSLISPLANLLVAPLIPLAMLFSFLSLLPFVGNVFAFLAYGILHLGLFITHALAQVPLADVGFGLGIIGLIGIYGVSGMVWWRLTKREKCSAGSGVAV